MSHKHLEVAMVADDLVVKRRGEENLNMYLLMLAHLVRHMNNYIPNLDYGEDMCLVISLVVR